MLPAVLTSGDGEIDMQGVDGGVDGRADRRPRVPGYGIPQ